jgi:hypothetical protein
MYQQIVEKKLLNRGWSRATNGLLVNPSGKAAIKIVANRVKNFNLQRSANGKTRWVANGGYVSLAKVNNSIPIRRRNHGIGTSPYNYNLNENVGAVSVAQQGPEIPGEIIGVAITGVVEPGDFSGNVDPRFYDPNIDPVVLGDPGDTHYWTFNRSFGRWELVRKVHVDPPVSGPGVYSDYYNEDGTKKVDIGLTGGGTGGGGSATTTTTETTTSLTDMLKKYWWVLLIAIFVLKGNKD